VYRSERPHGKRLLHEALPFLCIVFLVIGVAGILGPKLQDADNPGNPKVAALNKMTLIADAFSRYRDDLGEWPYPGKKKNSVGARVCAWLGSYSCLVERQSSSVNWRGPYLVKSPYLSVDGASIDDPVLDPWGAGFQVYSFPSVSTKRKFSVVCTGADRTLNTSMNMIAAGTSSGDDLVLSIK